MVGNSMGKNYLNSATEPNFETRPSTLAFLRWTNTNKCRIGVLLKNRLNITLRINDIKSKKTTQELIYITTFTILPGTTITFLGSFPSK